MVCLNTKNLVEKCWSNVNFSFVFCFFFFFYCRYEIIEEKLKLSSYLSWTFCSCKIGGFCIYLLNFCLHFYSCNVNVKKWLVRNSHWYSWIMLLLLLIRSSVRKLNNLYLIWIKSFFSLWRHNTYEWSFSSKISSNVICYFKLLFIIVLLI